MSSNAGSPERLPVLLYRGEVVDATQGQDQLLPLLLGAVLERLLEVPGTLGQVPSPPSTLVHGSRSAVLSVSEAADALGISASLAYRLVGRGELPSVRLGRRLVVPRVAIERMLTSAPTPAVDAVPQQPWTATIARPPAQGRIDDRGVAWTAGSSSPKSAS